jgi:hypothetical protein
MANPPFHSRKGAVYRDPLVKAFRDKQLLQQTCIP